MKTDIYGNAISTRSGEAADAFNIALEQIRLFHGDPIASLDAAIAADPQFGLAWATRAGLLAQAVDKLYAGEIARSLKGASAAQFSDRERAHFKAAVAWSEGRFGDGAMIYARTAQDWPRDLLALQNAHASCFFLGRQSELRDWPLQALRLHAPGDPGYHAVLGMAAFGLEECGDYDQAQAMGEEAVRIEGRDAWAAHAVAHVHEMRGDLDNGIEWLNRTSPGWSVDCGFGYHNWWHLALLHLDRGEIPSVLAVYDERIRPNPEGDILMEWIDASAMLWRLHLEGVDVRSRAEPLADAWMRTVEDGVYAFNDLHAVMAFIAAGRMNDARRSVASLRQAARDGADNGYMSATVGLPLAEAFVAFGEGSYREAAEGVMAVRGVAQRFGGSHAQRDALSLTAIHAALRCGMKGASEALAAERLAHKPQSPWARRLADRARSIGAGAIAAE
jgi:tetratricopeptide (TPR) repeat protein